MDELDAFSRGDLFFVDGDAHLSGQLLSRYEDGDLSAVSTHSGRLELASVLVTWLLALPEPLISAHLFKRCIRLAAQPEASPSDLEHVIELLPPLNAELLRRLLSLLHAAMLAAETDAAFSADRLDTGIDALANGLAPAILRSRAKTTSPEFVALLLRTPPAPAYQLTYQNGKRILQDVLHGLDNGASIKPDSPGGRDSHLADAEADMQGEAEDTKEAATKQKEEAEEAARVQAEAEAARLAAEQEAAKLAAEKEAQRVAAEEEEARAAAARLAAEQEAARQAEVERQEREAEQERQKAREDEEQRRQEAERAAEQARGAADEQAAREAAEAEARRAAEEAERARAAAAQEAARIAAEQERARLAAAEKEEAAVEQKDEAAAAKIVAGEHQAPVAAITTRHGCVCKPASTSPRSGHRFDGCGWPEYGWCDVEPGCSHAREQIAGYAGWDTCQKPAAGNDQSPAQTDDKPAAKRPSAGSSLAEPTGAAVQKPDAEQQSASGTVGESSEAKLIAEALAFQADGGKAFDAALQKLLSRQPAGEALAGAGAKQDEAAAAAQAEETAAAASAAEATRQAEELERQEAAAAAAKAEEAALEERQRREAQAAAEAAAQQKEVEEAEAQAAAAAQAKAEQERERQEAAAAAAAARAAEVERQRREEQATVEAAQPQKVDEVGQTTAAAKAQGGEAARPIGAAGVDPNANLLAEALAFKASGEADDAALQKLLRSAATPDGAAPISLGGDGGSDGDARGASAEQRPGAGRTTLDKVAERNREALLERRRRLARARSGADR